MVGIIAVTSTSFRMTYVKKKKKKKDLCEYTETLRTVLVRPRSRPLSTHTCTIDSRTFTGKPGSVSCRVRASFS